MKRKYVSWSAFFSFFLPCVIATVSYWIQLSINLKGGNKKAQHENKSRWRWTKWYSWLLSKAVNIRLELKRITSCTTFYRLKFRHFLYPGYLLTMTKWQFILALLYGVKCCQKYWYVDTYWFQSFETVLKHIFRRKGEPVPTAFLSLLYQRELTRTALHNPISYRNEWTEPCYLIF